MSRARPGPPAPGTPYHTNAVTMACKSVRSSDEVPAGNRNRGAGESLPDMVPEGHGNPRRHRLGDHGLRRLRQHAGGAAIRRFRMLAFANITRAGTFVFEIGPQGGAKSD